MSNFAVRRWLLVASMVFCQVALAEEPKGDAKAPAAKEAEAKSDTNKKAEPEIEPVVPPAAPFKLLAALKPVSMEVVDQVIEASDRAVQACSKNPRRLDTLAVLMAITIDADGKVSEAVPAPQEGDNGKVPPEAACLARLTKKLKFPATGTTTHVQYPFMIVSRVNRAPSY
ncbi:MAG TPA: hypothetical protein VF997_17785 [Polyangia bacterium]